MGFAIPGLRCSLFHWTTNLTVSPWTALTFGDTLVEQLVIQSSEIEHHAHPHGTVTKLLDKLGLYSAEATHRAANA